MRTTGVLGALTALGFLGAALAQAATAPEAAKPAAAKAKAAVKAAPGKAAPTAATEKVAPPPAPAPPPLLTIPAFELRTHASALATGAMAGRAPGSSGEAQATAYLSAAFQQTGLLPGGDAPHGAAGFAQSVNVLGVRGQGKGTAMFSARGPSIPVQTPVGARELVLIPGTPGGNAIVRDEELVFAGYGLAAPEHLWDDYKGTDVKGKVVLVLDGDPASDPKSFSGRALTRHGRADLKVAEAARRGAKAVLLIFDPARGHSFAAVRATYAGEWYAAPFAADEPRPWLRGTLSEDACRRILQGAGLDLDTLRRNAESRAFLPMALPITFSAQAQGQVRRFESTNLVGVLPGSDARLRSEAVVITAHYDGLGTRPLGVGGAEATFPGVTDNATGVAALLAMAKAAVAAGPLRRTLVFAAVTAQSEDLVGARHLLKKLPAPVEKAVAHVNLDGMTPDAAVAEIIQLGRGRSSAIDEALDGAAALWQRRRIEDPAPERGLYYRSDSLAFAQAAVPSLYLFSPALDRYLSGSWRQPGDGLREDQSFDGAAQDAQLLLTALRTIGNGAKTPAFAATDEFAPRPESPTP